MTAPTLVSLTATEAAAEIARGTISAEEYTRACLERIARVEAEVQAFAHLDPEIALSQARALDARRAKGRPIGPLHGIPVAIKDIIDTAVYPTECGSAIYTGRRPAYDATVVAKLRAAGAIVIGKTVTTEFAYFHPGKTRNPRDPARTPGGSSSGSAAAVAAGMVPLALGSQTNGSMIRPAAFCGVVGVKPTRGLISRAGVLPLSRSLDHVGAFARSVADIALVLDVLAGRDEFDPDTLSSGSPNYRAVTGSQPPAPPRLAFVRTPIWDTADARTREEFEKLAGRLGKHCTELELSPRFAGAWSVLRTIMSAEMAENLWPMVERSGDVSSKALRDFLAEGKRVELAQYRAALDEARGLAAEAGDLLRRCDAFITPATIGVAPVGLESTGNPAFCSLWTLTGLPALSLPLLEGDDGLPLGVQLVGAAGGDARLLRTAAWLARTLGATTLVR